MNINGTANKRDLKAPEIQYSTDALILAKKKTNVTLINDITNKQTGLRKA